MAHTVSRSLSDETLNRIMAIESRGKLKAKAPTSSALGPFQFLNGTFLDTVKAHRPDLLHGRSTQQVLALRTDPTVGIELGARFTEDNARVLGAHYTDGDLYLAHFLGVMTAKKFLRAPDDASAAALAGAKAVAANRSILAGKTTKQVRLWAQRSMRTRWDECHNVDWVAQYFDPHSPLAQHHHDAEHELVDGYDDYTPVKHEENFTRDEPETEDDTPLPRPRPREADEDEDDTPSFFDTAKSMFKSKIAWLAGLLGLSGAGSASSSDPDVLHLLLQLVTKPAFLLTVAAIVAAVAIVYFRWRDHGRGKT